MRRKIVSGIMLSLLLIGMLTLAFNIQPIKAEKGVLNLIQNPGFEDQLAFWSVSTGYATYSADDIDPVNGSYSAKGVEIYTGSLGRLYQDVTGIAASGKRYKISGWIKTQDVVGYVVIALNYVSDYGVTPADGYVKEIGYVTGSTDWAYYESDVFILPPMPSNASAIWFLFDFNNGKGTAWWDDVSLIEIPLVLIDEGHSEWLLSGNTQFLIQNLEERGYLVQTLTGTITPSSLEDCDVLVIGEAWDSFTQSELQAIEEFVKNSGGLLLTGVGWSWVGYHPESTIYDYPMNQIAQKFGGFFNQDIIYDPTNYTTEPASPIFHKPFIKSHPITVGVSEVAYWGFPSSISLATGVALITGDDDSYGGYGESPYPNPGMYPPFLGAIEYFLGRIVLVGGLGIFVDGGIHLYDNKILGVNIINWLLQLPPYALTIYSSPAGVTFTVDGVSHTTPWSGTYSEGASVSLIMPEIHTFGDARYYWNQWSDGNTSRSRTVTMNTDITLTAYYTGPYYQLTVTSSPITGIPFTIDGTPKTTPYTEWLPEGSYTLIMPETHNGYVWSRWLEDGDTNRIKTITLPGTTWTGIYVPKPVGGEAIPIDKPIVKPELQIPWTWLTTIILSVVLAGVYVKKRKRNTRTLPYVKC